MYYGEDEGMFDPLLISLCLLVGVLIGLAGVSRCALLTPLLILIAGVRLATTVGTDLAFAAATKVVGAYQHTRHGTSDSRLISRLPFGNVSGVLLGSWLVTVLEAREAASVDVLLTRILGLVLLIAASASLWRALGLSWAKDSGANPIPRYTVLLSANLRPPELQGHQPRTRCLLACCGPSRSSKPAQASRIGIRILRRRDQLLSLVHGFGVRLTGKNEKRAGISRLSAILTKHQGSEITIDTPASLLTNPFRRSCDICGA
jgi:hypothetical protein